MLGFTVRNLQPHNQPLPHWLAAGPLLVTCLQWFIYQICSYPPHLESISSRKNILLDIFNTQIHKQYKKETMRHKAVVQIAQFPHSLAPSTMFNLKPAVYETLLFHTNCSGTINLYEMPNLKPYYA
jgi:hypothetical protein